MALEASAVAVHQTLLNLALRIRSRLSSCLALHVAMSHTGSKNTYVSLRFPPRLHHQDIDVKLHKCIDLVT
ncbi:hypothetical protein E2C01_006473 [Portunus trituberculatus]|uniref:Uncharacterized protein n=1 Tax=Portunus trituberculatus TaxID=210409 RepID=A0A5B7CWD8_PORTR|nr:hypothetical protein [Portunus trituberculatus]